MTARGMTGPSKKTGQWCPGGRHLRVGARSDQACEACAGETAARAAVLVAGQLDGVTTERARRFVDQLCRSQRRLDRLVGHLQTEPEALRSGDSNCPKVVIDLLDVLVAAGVDGAAHARCVVCAQPRRQLQTVSAGGRVCESCRHRAKIEPCQGCGRTAAVRLRTSAGPWCDRCTAADESRWEPCLQCGTPGQVIMRVDGRPVGRCCYATPVIRCTMCGIVQGVKPWKSRRPVCAGCAKREHVACGQCGKDAPPAASGADPICAVCVTNTARPCTGCSAPTPGRDRTGTPRCADCYQRPARACGRCGRIRAIARLATGDDPELCALCWTGPTVECASCGQLRPCRGERRGRMLCASCAPVAPQRCSHCGHSRRVSAHWHEGPVCRSCCLRALARKGCCPGCAQTRRLMHHPGWDTRVCATCAGAPPLAVCTRCGAEDALYRRRLCPACSLHDVLDELLGDRAARARNGLQPVVDRLLELDRPRWVLDWLRRERSSAGLLTRFAREELPLSHDAFAQLPDGRSSWFIERLLVASGALPERDPILVRMERWTTDYLTTVADPDRRALLRRFATWQLLRPLRVRSQTSSLPAQAHNARKRTLTMTSTFLTWLDQRGRGLDDCTQELLDQWAVTGPAGWETVGPFLTWARQQGLVGPVQLPSRRRAAGASLVDTEQRWTLARRLLSDPDIDPVIRVAGLLVVLYAQPVSRIVRLRYDDIIEHDDRIELRVGSSPIRLPPPLSHHIHGLLDPPRPATVSAVSGPDRWLFPGRMPGRPLNSVNLCARLREAGIPTNLHRQAALAHLAATMPAAIVADLLGVSVQTATKWAELTGRTWTDYTTHRRPPTGT